MKKHVLLVIAAGVYAVLCVATPGLAAPVLSSGEKDPRRIMEAVHGRDDGNRGVGRMRMTIKDAASSVTRERVLSTRSIDFEEGQKNLLIFEAPGDLRNTALLSFDYDEGQRDDEQWLYLPSLHRSSRITSSKKSGSFMESDFSFADMTKADPKEYDFKLIQQNVDVDGESCWLIEATPRTKAEAEETGYTKSHVWVSKEKLIAVQIKAWMRSGGKLKYIKVSRTKQVDGIWTAFSTTARTVAGQKLLSQTDLEVLELRYGVATVTSADFSVRRLESGL